MRNFFEKLQWKMQRFMTGRYGQDALSLAMMYTAMVLLIVTLFWKNSIVAGIGSILVFLSFFRTISKNTSARRQELAAYQKVVWKVKSWFDLQKRKWNDRNTYRYFKCKCGKTVRVPKGAGKIEIKCPVCGNKFIKTV